jgi:hypothetical protein
MIPHPAIFIAENALYQFNQVLRLHDESRLLSRFSYDRFEETFTSMHQSAGDTPLTLCRGIPATSEQNITVLNDECTYPHERGRWVFSLYQYFTRDRSHV